MPTYGLDPSWQFAMNEAVSRHIPLGRILIFTLGPFAALYTDLYDPTNDGWMLPVAVTLAAFYWAVVIWIARGTSLAWIVALAYAASAVFYDKDAVLAAYGLMLSVLLHRLCGQNAAATPRSFAPFVLLTAPLGLMPLIKGSLALTSLAYVLVFAVLLWALGHRKAACGVVAMPAITMVLAWMLAGQAPVDLLSFVRWMIPFITGYGDAMSRPSDGLPPLVFLASAGAILAVLVYRPGKPLLARAALVLTFAAYLYVTFKGGFVRDGEHRRTAGSALVIAGVLLGFTGLRARPLAFVALLAAGGGVFIAYQQIGSLQQIFVDNSLKTYRKMASGLGQRLLDPQSLVRDYAAALKNIRAQTDVGTMPGTSDLYFADQAFLLASDNQWTPRAVLQSYSAFTPSLAGRDHDTLLRHPPDNVMIHLNPIDGRLPSLDDGSSWPVLFNTYRPDRFSRETLQLVRAAAASDPPIAARHHAGHQMGETIRIRPTGDVLFAQVTISKTWLGKLLSILLKIDPLQIQVTQLDGATKTFRLIAGMTETGFIISPLAENTADFASLFGDRAILSEKSVVAFTIRPAGGSSPFWRTDYDLRLGAIDMTKAQAQPSVDAFPRPTANLPEGAASTGPSEVCEIGIDTINGEPFDARPHDVINLLSIQGWMTVDGANSKVPQEVFAVVTDPAGPNAYVKAQRYPRPDVNAYFGHLDMAPAGFRVDFAIPPGTGARTLGLARIRDGVLHDCANFSVPLHQRDSASQLEHGVTPRQFSAQGLIPSPVDACEAGIDLPLKGQPASPAHSVSQAAAPVVSGWMTIDGANGLVPDSVYITMTDPQGGVVYFPAQRTKRDDLLAHFHRNSMPEAGFSLDLSTVWLSGPYSLGLARRYKDRLEYCRGMAVPVTLPAIIN